LSLNPILVLGLTGLGNDNFSSAIDRVDSDEAGLTGRGGARLEGEPAEAFQAGLGLLLGFIGEVGRDFGLVWERGGAPVPVPPVDLVGVDVEDPVTKSFIDNCFIFVFIFAILPFAVSIPGSDEVGALNVNEKDFRTPAAESSKMQCKNKTLSFSNNNTKIKSAQRK
jgi:hypothetical protein